MHYDGFHTTDTNAAINSFGVHYALVICHSYILAVDLLCSTTNNGVEGGTEQQCCLTSYISYVALPVEKL